MRCNSQSTNVTLAAMRRQLYVISLPKEKLLQLSALFLSTQCSVQQVVDPALGLWRPSMFSLYSI